MCLGHALAQLNWALSYKPEGRGFIRIFLWHNPSSRILALKSTLPLTKMSTRNVSWRVMKAGAYGWQPYAPAFMCWLSWSLGASASWNPEALSRSVLFTLNFLYVGVWTPHTPHILSGERIPGSPKQEAVQIYLTTSLNNLEESKLLLLPETEVPLHYRSARTLVTAQTELSLQVINLWSLLCLHRSFQEDILT